MLKLPSHYIINLFHTVHRHLKGEFMIKIKNVLFVLIFLAMMLLTGCGEPSHSYYSLEDSGYDTADFLELEMECSEYERDVKEITFSLANSSDKTFWFGYDFDLHRFDDDSGEWKGVAFEKEHFFYAVAIGVNSSKPYTYTIDLEEMYNLPLSPGRYRLVKDGGLDGEDGKYYVMYAEFTIK